MYDINAKPKYTFGVLVGQLEENYQSRVWPGIVDAAEKLNINIVFFVGKSPCSPYGYDYQHNVVYDFINGKRLDGLILLSGTLGNHINKEELKNFYYKFKPLPMVSIAAKLDGIPSILVDNIKGIKDSIAHLIEVHGCKRIAYISGPKGHWEADIRYHAYTEALAEYNIPLDFNLITFGDFVSNMGEQAVIQLVDERRCKFDSIVAANDGMAIGALKALKERNIKVPKDIPLIGFDDTNEVNFINPPLTTVKQPLYEQGRKSVEMLMDCIEKKEIPDTVNLQTKLVIRQSCGCFFQSIVQISKDEISINNDKIHFFDELEKNKKNMITEIVRVLSIKNKLKTEITDIINKLIDSIVKDIESENKSDFFLKELNELFIDIVEKVHRFYQWYYVLNIFRKYFLNAANDYHLISRIEYIFQKARILFGEIYFRAQLNQRMNVEKTIWLLQDVSQYLITSFELHELMDEIALEIPRLGINSCYISLYKGEVIVKGPTTWQVPEESQLVFAYNETGRFGFEEKKMEFKTKDLIPKKLIPKNKRYTLILMPLFFKVEHFGFVLFELGPRIEIIYETLRAQISSAVKGAMLFNERVAAETDLKDTLTKLERINKKLHRLSLADELTGLYNRRGFVTLGNQHLIQSLKTKNSFLIFFSDMDNLKSINDSFGHDEGDKAIIKTAEILEKTFRQIDIIARYGGDEFVILCVDTSENDSERFINRLKEKFLEYNAVSEKPYDLSLSIGFVSFNGETNKTLDDLINSADKMLYKDKISKKSV